MTANLLLEKLDGVKETGRGRWIARCPAHSDGRPSLSVRALDDGRVLLHCFAECSVADVLAVVGLDFDALYPPRAIDHCVRRERDPFNARDVLFALHDEALIVAIAGARLAYGYDVDDDERDRMMLACLRFINARDLLKPHPADGHRDYVPRADLDEVAHAA